MTIDLFIVRHAEAEERDAAAWPDDRLRPLTSKGRKRFQRVARMLASANLRPQRLLASSFKRAWGTAEILHVEAGWPSPQRCEALEDGDADAIVQFLQSIDRAPCIAVVGHEPSLSETVSLLLAGDEQRISVNLAKGGVILLRSHDEWRPQSASLHWYLRPALARKVKR